MDAQTVFQLIAEPVTRKIICEIANSSNRMNGELSPSDLTPAAIGEGFDPETLAEIESAIRFTHITSAAFIGEVQRRSQEMILALRRKRALAAGKQTAIEYEDEIQAQA